MKKIMGFFCLLFSILACESDTNSRDIANKLYGCLMQSLSQEEKEKVTVILADYEKYLIDKGVLESSSAQSYWNVYKEFAETTPSDFKNDFNFNRKISFLNDRSTKELQGLFDCHDAISATQEYK